MMPHELRSATFTLAILCLAGSALASSSSPREQPLIVVLAETGTEVDGLPVLTLHPDGDRIAAEIEKGVAGELARVYRLLQIGAARDARQTIEPAYLLLSSKQGGFARYGFWLDEEKKDGTAFVDLHKSSELNGRFGAIDQIFPHELSHAILHNLGIDEPPTAGSNQVHAVGVRTDRYIAFNEGLAEHFQVMAVDHPGADPSTRALTHSSDSEDAARRHLEAYRGELAAWGGIPGRMRIGFPLWYSNDERVLRYFAVRNNEFAYQPHIPDRLLEDDPYRAWLIESVLPGEVGGELRSVPRLLATEGVVSALFYRWATNERLLQSRADDTFYARYEVEPDDLTPLQNLYLKLFHAAGERGATDVAQLVEAYREIFPHDAAALDEVVAVAFVGQRLDLPPQIWLANESFRVGTTLFDQFRGEPRAHTFDLNAAALVDLMSVPGMSLETAHAIRSASPFQSVDDVAAVTGVDADLVTRMREMSHAMDRLREEVETENLSFSGILWPYAWVALAMILVAAMLGGAIHAVIRQTWDTRPGLVWLSLNGLGAAIVAVLTGLITGSPMMAVAAVALVYGLPAALWRLKSRRPRVAIIVLAAWIGTAIPGALFTQPWF